MTQRSSKISRTNCIEWKRARNKLGYGLLTAKGRSWLAHRWAWTQECGAIPDGLCVLHRCDNPPCVNVDHLFLGTRRDNNLDCMAKGRRPPPAGERNSGVKINPHTVRRILALKGTMTQREIGLRYGLGDSQMSRIMHGQSWKNITTGEIHGKQRNAA